MVKTTTFHQAEPMIQAQLSAIAMCSRVVLSRLRNMLAYCTMTFTVWLPARAFCA
jgi:hypothetical protein